MRISCCTGQHYLILQSEAVVASATCSAVLCSSWVCSALPGLVLWSEAVDPFIVPLYGKGGIPKEGMQVGLGVNPSSGCSGGDTDL